tara:strand:+ start:3830 stop:4411 length:582 start_codon:yes stop_codon:yes gene_type:complete
MIPSFSQLMSGLSFAFSLLRGRPFDLVKSQVNIGPLGLWHVLFITSIVSILAKLAIFQIAIPHDLPLRMILSTIPLMVIELSLFVFFVYYLLNLLKRNNYFYNFIISFFWLVTLQSSLVLMITVLLWVLPDIALLIAIVGAVISIQILIVQFKIAKQLLDLTTLSAIGIVFGNIIIGLIVGYLDQIFYSFFAV